MSSALSSGTATMSLAATIDDDDALYRAAQALPALSSAPGRRTLRVSHHVPRWDVCGVNATATQFAPPSLGLAAGLNHRGHLRAMLLSPLAVDAPPPTNGTGHRATYTVQRGGLPTLFSATHALAAALDAREEVRCGPWWTRRSRGQGAANHVVAALRAMRDAGAQVALMPLH